MQVIHISVVEFNAIHIYIYVIQVIHMHVVGLNASHTHMCRGGSMQFTYMYMQYKSYVYMS